MLSLACGWTDCCSCGLPRPSFSGFLVVGRRRFRCRELETCSSKHKFTEAVVLDATYSKHLKTIEEIFPPPSSGPEGNHEPFGVAGVSATAPLGPGEEERRRRPHPDLQAGT